MEAQAAEAQAYEKDHVDLDKPDAWIWFPVYLLFAIWSIVLGSTLEFALRDSMRMLMTNNRWISFVLLYLFIFFVVIADEHSSKYTLFWSFGVAAILWVLFVLSNLVNVYVLLFVLFLSVLVFFAHRSAEYQRSVGNEKLEKASKIGMVVISCLIVAVLVGGTIQTYMDPGKGPRVFADLFLGEERIEKLVDPDTGLPIRSGGKHMYDHKPRVEGKYYVTTPKGTIIDRSMTAVKRAREAVTSARRPVVESLKPTEAKPFAAVLKSYWKPPESVPEVPEIPEIPEIVPEFRELNDTAHETVVNPATGTDRLGLRSRFDRSHIPEYAKFGYDDVKLDASDLKIP